MLLDDRVKELEDVVSGLDVDGIVPVLPVNKLELSHNFCTSILIHPLISISFSIKS